MATKNWLHSLGSRLYVWVILFIIIPVIGVFVYSFWTFEKIMNEEISQRSIENISGIENEINNIFDHLVRASNVLNNDDSILQALLDGNRSYYERATDIDNAINNLMESNSVLSEAKITIFDNQLQVYSNWSLNFNDYRSLYEEDWMQQVVSYNGHLVWRVLEPSFIKEEKGKKYISLARVMNATGKREGKAGVLIIGLSEDTFIDIFQKNKYISSKDDSVIISNSDDKIIMLLDPKGISQSADTSRLLQDISGEDRGYLSRNIEGSKYLVTYYTISRIPWTFEKGEWKVTVFTLYDKIIVSLKAFSAKVRLFFGLFIVVVLVIAGILTVQIVKPIRRLNRRMKEFRPSGELARLDMGRKDEIGYLNLAFYNMAQNIQDLFEKLEAEHNIREKYRFESLRAQLNPHFLFNSLNTIRWMAILRKADNIVENIDALTGLLDYSMSRGSEYVALREEIAHIRSYVHIQNGRYGGKFELEVEADAILLEMRIIRFILQPAVENAILHGYKDANRQGCILVKAVLKEGNLAISVLDDGAGIPQERLAAILTEDQHKPENRNQITGIGLKIVNERIKMSYGHKYGVQIKSEWGKGTEVKFVLPFIREEGDGFAASDAR